MVEESFNDIELWGENGMMNTPVFSWKKEILNNIEHDVIINSIKNVSYKKYFCNQEELILAFIKKENPVITVNDEMKQTVQLIKYKNDIKGLVENGKLRGGMFDVEKQLRLISSPLYCTKKKKETDDVQFYKHSDSDFINGISRENSLNITAESALNVLRNSVSTVLAFVGFTVLTEVVENYIKIMLKLLHVNIEKEAIYGESGFCDIVDRTLHEVGFGSLKNLVSYYQNDVLRVKSKILKENQDELNMYEDCITKLKNENHLLNQSNSTETENENLIIPELHVTSITGNESLSQSFETGLQMLHSLERHQNISETGSKNSSDSELLLTELTNVKHEFNEIKSIKRKRK
ncbi:hypothetical protein PGB90_008340 [Kerria lacca]